jgi:shikimate dehydrogenase
VTITGKSAVYFMLADPVAHTKSPGMFNTKFERDGTDAVMVPISFPVEQFDAVWTAFKAMRNLKGMIVSVPFKKHVFEACDHANTRAARVQSANAVIRQEDGRFLCDNFDGAGFVTGMQRTGHAIGGKKALLIGAGGAGSSLAYCLAEEGASAVTISDVDQTRVSHLASLVQRSFPNCRTTAGNADPRGFDLVVNATPMGLRPDDPTPIDLNFLEPHMTVVDIIMEPRQTPLLKRAIELGCKVQYGQHMMDCQMDLLAEFLGL